MAMTPPKLSADVSTFQKSLCYLFIFVKDFLQLTFFVTLSVQVPDLHVGVTLSLSRHDIV
jgi:hypothetical protein